MTHPLKIPEELVSKNPSRFLFEHPVVIIIILYFETPEKRVWSSTVTNCSLVFCFRDRYDGRAVYPETKVAVVLKYGLIETPS